MTKVGAVNAPQIIGEWLVGLVNCACEPVHSINAIVLHCSRIFFKTIIKSKSVFFQNILMSKKVFVIRSVLTFKNTFLGIRHKTPFITSFLSKGIRESCLMAGESDWSLDLQKICECEKQIYMCWPCSK